MASVEQDPVQVVLEGLEKEKARETYGRALKRRSEVSGLSPSLMLQEARRDMKQFWIRNRSDASKLKSMSDLAPYPPYTATYGCMENFHHTTNSRDLASHA